MFENEHRTHSMKPFLKLMAVIFATFIPIYLVIVESSVASIKNIKPDYSIFDEYKAIKMNIIADYNKLLWDAKNSGNPVNVDQFCYNNRFNIISENNISIENSPLFTNIKTKTVRKLNSFLATSSNIIAGKLNKINDLLSQNKPIDYNSLKISSSNNNELSPIIKQYSDDSRQESNKGAMLLKIHAIILFGLIVVLVIGLYIAERFFG